MKPTTPESPASMTAAVSALDALLSRFTSPALADKEAEAIVADVLSRCREIPKDSGQFFYAVGDPEPMPSDARVDFLYRPTYLAAALLIVAEETRPALLAGPRAEILGGVLRACAGRNFHGHGYEAEFGLADAFAILLRAPLKAFLAGHAPEHPEFAQCVAKAVEELRGLAGGTLRPAWGKSNELVRRAKALLAKWEA